MNKIADELVKVANILVAKDEIAVGDKVKYSRKFLQSIGDYTSLGHLTGVVIKLEKVSGGEITLAEIKWNDGEAPSKVNVKNLVLKSKLHLEPV